MIKKIRKIFSLIFFLYILSIILCDTLGFFDKTKNFIEEKYLSKNIELIGVVTRPLPSIKTLNYYKKVNFYITLEKIQDKSIIPQKNFKILVSLRQGSYIPKCGDKVLIVGKIKKINLDNKYNKYLKYLNVYYKIDENSFNNYKYLGTGNKFDSFISNIREKILGKILKLYKGFPKEIIPGLMLGDKSFFSNETKILINNIGINHITAISGMHIAFLSAFLTLLFIKQNIFTTFLSIIFIWIYSFIVGAGPSCIRASSMITIFLISKHFNVKIKGINNLIFTAIIMLLIWPKDILKVSFILSFLGVFSILYFQNFVKKVFKNIFLCIDKFFNFKLGIKDFFNSQIIKNADSNVFNSKILNFLFSILKNIYEILIIFLAVQMTLFPITLFFFKKVNLFAFVFNLVIMPFLFFIINLSFFSIFLDFIFEKVIFLKYFSIFLAKINSLLINNIFSFLAFLDKKISFFITLENYNVYFLVIDISLILFLPILKDIKREPKYFYLFILWIILFLISSTLVL